ncbi:ATP-binding protein [Caulobacter segnis]|uniref:histidine kinase n=1 Tax=Caulobacter segnis TaxID=88688 RepID=A0A2W5VB15_9CAUL|nr:PAS domain-containing hybrid sensor histidine kinase/response regulator [Caulobacter segnis]PZR35817.1 MAG: hybrid sensor histidine kinase/response regulator [Caulobacter segnis]
MSHDAAVGLQDLAPCGLLVLNPEWGILSANRYVLDVSGRSSEALGASPKFTTLLTVASRILVEGRLQPQLAVEGRVEEIALDIRRPDGVRVPILLNAMQEKDADGLPGRIHVALIRAVAKRAYEAEVPKARQEAQAAQRVKADFLANVSHEIRTPLNGVIGVLGALRGTGLTARQQDMVALIESSAVTLERLVGDILEISKVEAATLSLETRPFRPLDDLRGVLDLTALAAQGKGLAFSERLGAGLDRRLVGDGVRLKQILNNLTSNAVKFTQAGGVAVDLAVEEREGVPNLLMVVEDSGVGFDEAEAEALFQHFHQVEGGLARRFGGVGLGLSITRALVDLMGGSITASSRPGQGSVFSVSLPLAWADEDSADERQAATADLDRPLRVLLVEDNPTNQQVVRMILEQADVALRVADNGAIGLEAWRGNPFDVVLMDMQMPVMDGLTAIRAIRGEEAGAGLPRTPIAVLSANAMDHHRAEALDAGADLHIAKPITAAGLLIGINTVLSAG